MLQKRNHKRIQLRCTLEVVDASTGTPLGQVIDIHIGGLRLTSIKPIAGHAHHLKLLLPEVVLEKKSISFAAQAAWTRKEDGVGSYTTGFSVHEMSSVNQDVISALIDKYGVNK